MRPVSIAKIISIAVACAGAALLFLASPWLIRSANVALFGSPPSELGLIGESYGGIGAALSGLAVLAVAAARVVQIRQVRTSQAHGVRLLQLELMRMLIDDLKLRPLTSDDGRTRPADVRRRNIYTNLIFKYMELGYEIGYFSSDSLQVDLHEQLAVEHVRKFWEVHRINRLETASNKAQRRFFEMVDQVYRNTASLAARDAAPQPARSSRWGPALGAALGFIVVVAVSRSGSVRRGTRRTARRT
ncbi:DUF6082 family protein [Asanoa sp. WMMD1127]|uniref:DUF6082 family protein n=1 Tax=Asanoa sp. WMMD1127 TaxID=3016107 RepID=UPI00241699DD|nr:DUF6082 family protein [Asanoa sp. WMMD1127]MDG4822028.1 DUF6082 family protein [Asanoa sp. WMMD1127]